MSELIKRQLSLALLKVHLGEVASTRSGTPASAKRSHKALTDPRVFCELQITGNAQERDLLEPGSIAERAPSRRKSSRHALPPPMAGQANQARTVAQWTLHPNELQLPLTHLKAARFNDRPAVGGWLGDLARDVVSNVLNDRRFGALERFAAATEWLPNGRPSLPLGMGRQLQSLLHTTLRPGDCLWLELAEPLGYLPLLPWETMLQPYVNAPVLRLSPHVLKPLTVQRALSVAVCISLPFGRVASARDALLDTIGTIRKSLPEHSTVHVFPDVSAHEFCVADTQPDERGRVVTTHDPKRAQQCNSNEEPWTSWIASSLAGRAIDIVHFCTHAFIYPDQARLIAAQLPAKDCSENQVVGTPVRYVTAAEVCRFLTQLGTWGAVFSTTKTAGSPHQSRSALRLFADQVARQRPGIVAFHDLSVDTECQVLARTYKFMAGDPESQPTRDAGNAVYCNPGSGMQLSPEAMALPSDLFERYERIQSSILATLQKESSLPVWMAAMQRTVELSISRIASAQRDSDSDAALRGVNSALMYVEKVFAERASMTYRHQSEMQQGSGNATQ